MVCRPASQMIMWKPTPCHTDITITAGRAVEGSLSQSTSKPNRELIRPSRWYMNFHSIATTTIEVTTGMKNSTRKAVMPRSFWLISTASPRARPPCSGTTTSTNTAMFRKASQNVGSSRSARRKLVNPTNSGVVEAPSRALVKPSVKDSRTGMTRNITMRTRAGRMKRRAARASERVVVLPRRLGALVFVTAVFGARVADTD